mgnify:CR=1 FL=1
MLPCVLAVVAIVAGGGNATTAYAQRPLTREQAVSAALATQPVLALAAADSAAAAAGVATARAYPNPSLTAQYSRAVPRYHTILDIPLDFPWIRSPRVGAAAAGSAAASLRLALARATVRFAAETSYARALALEAHARLSRGDALDADSLLRMARARMAAGDASELDVRLAEINAGQLENVAQDDSLTAQLALLDLQRLVGLSADTVAVVLADTLIIPGPDTSSFSATPVAVAAARADLEAAERAYALERRSVIAAPSFEAGIEGGDPSGDERWPLPLFGLSIPLPLFDRHGGAIGAAAASRDRARAALDLATREARAAQVRASRERSLAIARARRDARMLGSARAVARMALAAYAEGAAALPNVLEAQRNARAMLRQYADDVAAAEVADAGLRLATAANEVP